MSTATLYGTPLSLYTGKPRSYLIKAGVPYRELTTSGEYYRTKVRPLAGTGSVPTLELEDGQIIRDSTRIIDHYESLGSQFSPASPRQKMISLLFDVIGSEGLLRPAMHYRWDFPEENASFVSYHFETMAPDDRDAKEIAAKTMDRMRNAGRNFGATPDNFDVLESLYEQFLVCLNDHFSQHGYLLGGKPSIGDFGLMAPMYAHLGRDPYPLRLMQQKAVHVFRWVERMNRPEPDTGEIAGSVPDYLAEDDIPDTLVKVLQHVAQDFVPETLAAGAAINEWLAEHAPESGSKVPRAVGFCQFQAAGMTIDAIAQPYRFWLLDRVQSFYEKASASDKSLMENLLQSCGMKELLDIKLTRKLEFKDNLEVWV